MNLGKNLVQLATAPVRIGLAVADAGLEVAGGALGMAHRTVGDDAAARVRIGGHILGIDDAVERANRLARLMDENQPLGPGADTGRSRRSVAAAGRPGADG